MRTKEQYEAALSVTGKLRAQTGKSGGGFEDFEAFVMLNGDSAECVLIESLEELAEGLEAFGSKDAVAFGASSGRRIILNNSIHIWNHHSVEMVKEWGLSEFSFIGSYELTKHEWRELKTAVFAANAESVEPLLPVYGRVPVMETKNCVKKTTGFCDHCPGFFTITDRKRTDFPIYADCEHLPHCRNIIYNSVPTSLHKLVVGEKNAGESWYFNFTTEDAGQVRDILLCFAGEGGTLPAAYTTGHYNKAVL